MLGLGTAVNRGGFVAGDSFVGLLNESFGSGAAGAYSVRRLFSSANTAMTIRRDSDQSETDIGFVNGNLDEAAINTFCSGTTCTVSVWKDQSGNDNHATQTAAANQPTIYESGAIVKADGRAMLDFNGDAMFAGNLSYDIETLFVVTKPRATASRWLFDFDDGGSAQITEDGALGFTDYLDGNNYSGDYGLVDNLPRVLVRGENWSAPTQQMLKISARNTGETVSNPGQQELQEIIIYDSVKNSSDVTSIESNIGAYFTQNTPLLNTYTGAAAAYSLRKLRTAYTGSAVSVRRSNDNLEADIGFNSFGELDTVSLAAHCGSNDGFVTTWHDQASSNDATQTDRTKQPKIYDGTTGVVTENGKPAVDFDGTDDFMSASASLQNAVTVFLVYKRSATSYILDAISPNRLAIGNVTSGNAFQVYVSQAVSTTSKALNQQNLGFVLADTTNSFSELNGSTNGPGNSGAAANSSQIFIGSRRDGGTGHMTGVFQEIIYYNSDQSSNRTDIESNINTFYSIY